MKVRAKKWLLALLLIGQPAFAANESNPDFQRWRPCAEAYRDLLEQSGGRPKLFQKPFTSLEIAEQVATRMGIQLMPEVKALPPDEQLRLLNIVFSEYRKIPSGAIYYLLQHGHSLDIMNTYVVQHPRIMPIWWNPPPGGKLGQTYYDLLGISLEDGLNSILGARNIGTPLVHALVIHEVIHALDVHLGHEIGLMRLSFGEDWYKLHVNTNWSVPYLSDNPHESFTECVSAFLVSKESNARLKALHPEIHEYIRKIFERLNRDYRENDPILFGLTND